ncbi:VWA domain-containing protein [Spiroplasma turonicum]|uniref:Two-component regulator system yiem receptor component protein n=1 Tax=Spiroplasma turonicum TaxID=216946 RepID=A0A0K1P5K4_9MOLU|nr:VWA domain-containing protein [Spiroplasma turonicum]AKU79596.1 two-component regulator system yiem receptor component protein [Spiroplasma turonicum]ALX70618.1 two-component regulator system yiem receptor component protein [Spiroplasma turonicum]
MGFDMEKPMSEINKELEKLRKKDLHNSDFLLFKKQNEFAAEQLDDKINNFYSASNLSTIKQIKLPEPIRKEIIYYNYISDNFDEVSFSKNLNLIKNKLIEFDSPFSTYIDTMEWKIENGYWELKDRDWLTEFFRNWTFMLTKRIIDFRMKAVEDLRYNYLVEVYSIVKNYGRYAKIYKTLYDVFGKLTNIEDELKNQNIESISRFAEFLYKDPSILRIAELLGRLNGEDNLMEKNITEQIVTYPTFKKLPYNPEEIVGLTISKDIERLLPMEFASLFDEDFEIVFFKKFIESQLQTFLFESNERVIEHDVEEVEYEAPIPLQQGKFIVCIDTSGSMEGSGEYISKALALAVAKVALKEERDLVFLNFANDYVDEFTINAKHLNLKKLLEFISKSFYGKTNSKKAFLKMIEKMHSEDFKRADLLMISDFMMDSPPNSIRTKIADLKDNYNRFHSLVVGTMPNVETQDVFDNVMYYDPNDPYATTQIVKSLNDTLKDLRELKDEEVSYRDEQIAKFNSIRDKKRFREVHKESPKSKKLEEKKKKLKELEKNL